MASACHAVVVAVIADTTRNATAAPGERFRQHPTLPSGGENVASGRNYEEALYSATA